MIKKIIEKTLKSIIDHLCINFIKRFILIIFLIILSNNFTVNISQYIINIKIILII